ncbi:MAG: hypothetical protein ABDH63_02300 [Candidatus Caldarchaeales archaeon]
MSSPSLAERLARVVHDRLRGSMEITRALLEEVTRALASAGSTEDALNTAEEFVRVASQRRSMPMLANALRVMLRHAEEGMSPGEAASRTLSELEARVESSIEVLVRLLRGARAVMTYSYSSHVVRALRRLSPETAYVPISCPLHEGVRTAEELRSFGLNAVSVLDTDAVRALGWCEALVLGSDAVLRDGSVANRSGSRALAEQADRLGLRVCFLTDLLKYDLEGTWEGERLTFMGRELELFDLTPPLSNVLTVSSMGALRPSEFAAACDRALKGSASRRGS